LQTSIWDTAQNIITMFTKAPALNAPKKNLGGGSWADLFHAFLNAGKTFWEEFN
jgi:hypothetical protein